MFSGKAVRLSRLSGGFPFDVDDSTSKLVVSAPWLVYSVAAVVVRSFCGIFKILEARKNGVEGFPFFLSIGQQCVFPAVATASLWHVIKNREKINKFHNFMSYVNRILSDLKITQKKNNDLGVLFLAADAVLLCVLKYTVRYMSLLNMSDIIEAITTISTQVVVIGTVTAFTSFVRQIDNELDALNDQLGRIVAQQDTAGTSIGKGQELELELMTDAHYLLTSAGLRLNSAYCETYLAVICGSVWGVTSRAYSAAYWYFAGNKVGESLLQADWMCFWLAVIICTVIPCSNAQVKSVKFNRDLALLMIREPNCYNRNEKDKLQLHVSFDFTLKFDCGVFQMNRGLIHSILGQVAVFAVMLTQVSVQENPVADRDFKQL